MIKGMDVSKISSAIRFAISFTFIASQEFSHQLLHKTTFSLILALLFCLQLILLFTLFKGSVHSLDALDHIEEGDLIQIARGSCLVSLLRDRSCLVLNEVESLGHKFDCGLVVDANCEHADYS